MCTQAITVFVTGFGVLRCRFPSWALQAQSRACPARRFWMSHQNPLGKCLAAAGLSTINGVVRWSFRPTWRPSRQTRLRPRLSGDVVPTGPMAARHHLADGKFVQSTSNALMTLNEFVYDPNGSPIRPCQFDQGTFTFVAGNIAKSGDMKVDTPVATMGILGTSHASKFRMMVR